MSRASLSLVSLLALFSASASARKVHTHPAPSEWVQGARASADAALHLRLTLPSADIGALHAALAEVSTPGSEKYGQHLTREETGALVAPDAKTAAAVDKWLAEFGLAGAAKASVGGDVIRVDTTVGVAEKLLAPAQYYVYADKEDEHRTALRTEAWGVPDELATAVETAHPTNLFPVHARGLKDVYDAPILKASPGGNTQANASCANAFTPACARSTYSLGDYAYSGDSANGIAVFSTAAKYATSDLQAYLKKYNPTYDNETVVYGNAGGGKKGGSSANEEAALDMDLTVGITAPNAVELVDAPNSSYDDFPTSILDFVDWMLNLTDPKPIASISYGALESEIYHGSYAVADQACNALAQLGARGVSVLASSGDSGVSCSSASGKFDPQFPASCPYVTAVGATFKIPEQTIEWSGAGFSNHFGQPDYQSAAVSKYIGELGSKYKGQYNASGRAYPDTAAFGNNVPIYFDGAFTSVGGTSASCPIVASIVAALNDVQLKNGGAVLGFLNPWIYGNASSGFNDITSGTNDDCGAGFTSIAGWDAASGWGTPNFDKLQDLLP